LTRNHREPATSKRQRRWIFMYSYSTWFSFARTAKKPKVFFTVRANGNQLRFKAATASKQNFRFSVYCSFICLLCTYIMFSHLILHLIVQRSKVMFCMFGVICYNFHTHAQLLVSC